MNCTGVKGGLGVPDACGQFWAFFWTCVLRTGRLVVRLRRCLRVTGLILTVRSVPFDYLLKAVTVTLRWFADACLVG